MAGVSTLGQYLDQIARLKNQQTTLGDLSTQISSGKKTQQLSGLGNDIIKTTRARAGVNSLTQYNDNITNADRRLKLMQTSIAEIKAQAKNLSGSLTTNIQQGDYPDLAAMQKLASNVYEFIVDAMNQTDGDRYLFGGGDTSEQPVTDTGSFSSFLGDYVPDPSDISNPALVKSGVIGDWGDGTITTDQFIDAYNNVSDTVIGYSNALTSGTAGKTTVRVNDKSEFDYTTLANNPSMKQVLLTLGVIKSLPPVADAPGALNDPTATTSAADTPPTPSAEKQQNFYKVLNDLAKTLNSAIDGLDQESFKLSQTQAQISVVKDSHTDQINAYKDIVADVENSDITEVSVKLTQLQVQIQASYQVTAMLSQLSLANFLR